MLDITPFTDEQWWKLCDCNASLPVPLAEADISQPFVYDRKWGLFYVPFGRHQLMMGTLLAFHHGALRLEQVPGLEPGTWYARGKAADRWLEQTPGAAFRSSVGKTVQIANLSGLSPLERRIFTNITEVFP